tara:strand:- start:616 stop:1485 length:870 start_codon:yes stop_codon:yes gene_type:complete
MIKKLNKIAKDTNIFLKRYLKSQKKTKLIIPMNYGLLPGGKKIRSKILVDVGKIFKLNYRNLIKIGAAVECIHAYSLIHDDLPCMDNDNLRRGKLSAHKKFGESTAILAGNSLLTAAFEILSQTSLKLKYKTKVKLVNLISESSGHDGIAGGQYLDLNYERKKISLNKIIKMQIKKTGKLFSFCCVAPIIISEKFNYIKKFDKIGCDIGLLFQIADDLIDHSGNSKKVGKRTNKDLKKGKATLISILGNKNTIKYGFKLKSNIFRRLDIFGNKADDLRNTINYILERSK